MSKRVLQLLTKYWKDAALAIVLFSAVTMWMQKDMLPEAAAAQNFELASLSEQPTKIFKDGEPTLIYFFAPWCSICKLSMGNLSNLSDKINSVAVALDYKSRSEVQHFIKDIEVSVPVLLGNSQVARDYQISVFPSYYVIDAQGKILGRSSGYSSLAGLLWRTRAI